jgi:hypothetical protein
MLPSQRTAARGSRFGRGGLTVCSLDPHSERELPARIVLNHQAHQSMACLALLMAPLAGS